MAEESPDLEAERARLERLLKLRTGRLGFADNVLEIKRRLDDVRAKIADANGL